MHDTHLPTHLPRSFVLAVVLSLAVFAFGGATVADARSSAQRAPVASNSLGSATSSFSGTTRDGRAVRGKFVPYKFVNNNGRILAKGTLRGVIEGKAGVSRSLTFSKPVTDRIKTINGMSWREALAGPSAARAQAAPECDILHLVLGPLDLDILGLQVHLNRVVLDIVAVAGAGNLLGNLLCAVAGLLDGGLGGLLSQVSALLNLILGSLNLGPLPV
jgi:hypothetical protein